MCLLLSCSFIIASQKVISQKQTNKHKWRKEGHNHFLTHSLLVRAIGQVVGDLGSSSWLSWGSWNPHLPLPRRMPWPQAYGLNRAESILHPICWNLATGWKKVQEWWGQKAVCKLRNNSVAQWGGHSSGRKGALGWMGPLDWMEPWA